MINNFLHLSYLNHLKYTGLYSRCLQVLFYSILRVTCLILTLVPFKPVQNGQIKTQLGFFLKSTFEFKQERKGRNGKKVRKRRYLLHCYSDQRFKGYLCDSAI